MALLSQSGSGLHKVALSEAAKEQTQKETYAKSNSDGRKWVALDCIAGFVDRVRSHVVSTPILTARHLGHVVTQIPDVVLDLLGVRVVVSDVFRAHLSTCTTDHSVLHFSG
jgi:hypothetical protein